VELLHATKITIGGSDFDLIEGESATIKNTAKIIDPILSTNPNPAERVVVGREFEVKAVLAAASLANMTTFFGGSGAHVENQDIATLAEFAVTLTVQTTTDGAEKSVALIAMNIIPEYEMSFKLGERYYLPIVAKSSETTTMTIAVVA
jgi:hypothetical protein